MAERREQMFPALSAAQIARLTRIGKRREVSSGEIVFEEGEAIPGFYVVLSGEMAIVQRADGGETTITVHHAGEFTGEVNMLTGRPSLVRARMATAGELLAISPEALRKIVQTDAELSELLMRAFILRRVALITGSHGDTVLIGSTHSAATLRIREFLGRNGQPFTYVDADKDRGVQALLDRFGVGVADVPVLSCRNERVLKSPSNAEIAKCLGFNHELDPGAVHDVVVVGAGPAGLAAAVYAASEGLDVLVLEGNVAGGQAGSSSKIENYLGFPTGISGEALAARAFTQALKFGAEVAIARSATRLDCSRRPYELELSDGARIKARAVVIASGVQYRKLECADLQQFAGIGVYYAAGAMEAQLCADDEEVIVVGGANSAGQAAVFLSPRVKQVHVLVRGRGLSETMSRYLIGRIEGSPNIAVRAFHRVVGLEGNDHLERVRVEDTRSGEKKTLEVRHVFVMTGADPNTDWLKGCVALDPKGFVKTGPDLDRADLAGWQLARPPHLLETSAQAVFAVGDVRSGSVKRVASAVGEGSACIQAVHRTLSE
ncbi:MAG: FAD-dependent oxidoreductase [Myxococcales bacterium]